MDGRERAEFVELQNLGRHAFSLYGLANEKFSMTGLRLLGRMLVETKLDHYAKSIASVAHDTILSLCSDAPHHYSNASGVTLIDPFSGAGNLFYHFSKLHAKDDQDNALFSSPQVIAFELNKRVFNVAHHNLTRESVLGNDIHYIHADCMTSVFGQAVPREEEEEKEVIIPEVPHGNFVVVAVDPPWRDAQWETSGGMDLDKTEPSVKDIIKAYSEKFPKQLEALRLVFVIPCPARVQKESVDDLFTSNLLLPLSPSEVLVDVEGSQLVVVGLAVPPGREEELC